MFSPGVLSAALLYSFFGGPSCPLNTIFSAFRYQASYRAALRRATGIMLDYS